MYQFGNGYNPYASGFVNPYAFNNNFDNQNMSNMPQMQQSQTSATQNDLSIAYVQTVAQVEQVQLPPGARRLIMVQNEPVVAMRVADSMGLTTTDYYKLTKYNPSESAPVAESTRYVTEEQLEARLKDLLEKMKGSVADESTV